MRTEILNWDRQAGYCMQILSYHISKYLAPLTRTIIMFCPKKTIWYPAYFRNIQTANENFTVVILKVTQVT